MDQLLRRRPPAGKGTLTYNQSSIIRRPQSQSQPQPLSVEKTMHSDSFEEDSYSYSNSYSYDEENPQLLRHHRATMPMPVPMPMKAFVSAVPFIIPVQKQPAPLTLRLVQFTTVFSLIGMLFMVS